MTFKSHTMFDGSGTTEHLREVVNGTLLPQYNGKKVSLTGLVTNVAPNGMSFEMNTVDDVTVKVNLKKPQKDIARTYVEVFTAHTLIQHSIHTSFYFRCMVWHRASPLFVMK